MENYTYSTDSERVSLAWSGLPETCDEQDGRVPLELEDDSFPAHELVVARLWLKLSDCNGAVDVYSETFSVQYCLSNEFS